MNIRPKINRDRSVIAALLLPVLFLALFYVLYFSVYMQRITMRLHIESNMHDTMVFYLPDTHGGYSESRSRRVRYPAGKSGHEFTIAAYPANKALRFDPGLKGHEFRLLDLSVERFGVEQKLAPGQIASVIDHVSSVEKLDGGNGVLFKLKPPDPQIYLSSLPRPGPQWQSIAATIAMLALMAALGRWLSGLRTGVLVQILAGVFLLTLFAPLNGQAHFYQGLLLAAFYAIGGASAFWALFNTDQEQPGQAESGVVSFGAVALTILFVTALWWPLDKTMTPNLLNTIKSHAEKILAENDSLNDRLKQVRDALEHDFVRNFAYRDWLINLNARFKIFALGFSPTSKAILGKDGMFFEGYGGRRVEGDITRSFDNITDYMGQTPFSPQELEAWRISLEERYYWLKERGIDYVFALAPTKALIFPEKLPEAIYAAKKKINKPTRYEQLIAYLKKKSVVPVVDLRSTLLAAKKNAIYPLFYRTDFHWNYYGSFLAYRSIVDTINQSYPKYELTPGKLSDFRIDRKDNWVHLNFMRVLGLDPLQNQDETYLTFYPKPGSRYARIDSYKTKGISDYNLPKVSVRHYAGDRLAVREIDNPAGKVPMMVIIGDSFIEKTLGFFSVHNQRTINFRAVTSFPVGPYETQAPDIVVQEILNMYILQPPPSNPAIIKKARVRALARADKAQ